MTNKVTQFARRARRGIIWRVHHILIDRDFDRRHGVNTSGKYYPDILDLQGKDPAMAVEYEPTPTLLLKYLLAGLALDLRRFVFIDLGSGKGRTLLLAAERPFARVEGVELSRRMHQVALRNITSVRNGEESRVISNNIDAAAYAFPSDPFVVFLFNPFEATVLESVSENLRRSLCETPREGYVIYLNARHKRVLDETEFLQQVPRSRCMKAMDALISPWPVAIYRTVANL